MGLLPAVSTILAQASEAGQPAAEAPRPGFDFVDLLIRWAMTFGWALVGAISMGVAIIIMLKFFTWATVEIDEWEEVKKGNIAVAIILAAVIIGAAVVVAVCVIP